jgi:hypothetical protein
MFASVGSLTAAIGESTAIPHMRESLEDIFFLRLNFVTATSLSVGSLTPAIGEISAIPHMMESLESIFFLRLNFVTATSLSVGSLTPAIGGISAYPTHDGKFRKYLLSALKLCHNYLAY